MSKRHFRKVFLGLAKLFSTLFQHSNYHEITSKPNQSMARVRDTSIQGLAEKNSQTFAKLIFPSPTQSNGDVEDFSCRHLVNSMRGVSIDVVSGCTQRLSTYSFTLYRFTGFAVPHKIYGESFRRSVLHQIRIFKCTAQ